MSVLLVQLSGADIYQDNKPVLTDVNLEISPGEFCYLIGKTGTGKSSLLKTLYGELPLVKGQGKVAGFDLRKLKTKQIPYLRRKLGIVFQDFQLLNDRNVYENLRFVLQATGWKDKTKMNRQINKVLEQVNMTDKIKEMPYRLSGGEQQRVSIARALLNEPELILADEPTGNLDPETSNEILKLFKEINQNGKTVLFATHDFPMIYKFPSTTYNIEGGKLFEVEIKVN